MLMNYLKFFLFFIYQVILKLREFGYKKNELTKFEIDNFLIFCQNHSDLDQVVGNIIKYRSYGEIYELEKFLKANNRMDSRFFSILKNIKYFNFNKKKIAISENYIDEISNKIKKFNQRYANNKVIFFDKKNQNKYKKFLGEDIDLTS